MAEAAGMTKRIWLHLLKEGGRWSAAEITEHFKGDPHSILNCLRAMATCQSLKKFEKEGGSKRVQYGITPSCRIANGVTVADILAADLAPFLGEGAKQ